MSDPPWKNLVFPQIPYQINMNKKTKTNIEIESHKSKRLPVGTRGRSFKGKVVRKFSNRITIELERTVYVRKYESFYKKKTRIHARLPETIPVELGNIVTVKECRPLSKIIHHIVVSNESKESKK